MGPATLHWVVQRSALTGALITFVSFSDCADAERHKAELEAIVDPLGRTNVLAVESLPVNQVPETKSELALEDQCRDRCHDGQQQHVHRL